VKIVYLSEPQFAEVFHKLQPWDRMSLNMPARHLLWYRYGILFLVGEDIGIADMSNDGDGITLAKILNRTNTGAAE
jgi:hypothetical protein